jgi:secreted trypsin-like serine protease
MVTTVTSYTDSRNRADTGQGYDGVVRISVAGYYGTGVLLYDGRAVLTAAHLFSHGSTTASVQFETTQGTQTLSGSKTLVYPGYDAANESGDLAIVWLSQSAPTAAERSELYRSTDEISQIFTMVGYGQVGTGASGVSSANNTATLRQKAANQFDATADALKAVMGSSINWTPKAGTQLVADFDDGSTRHDALGQLIQKNDTGLGRSEGLIAQGDSGGPAFIGNKVAGVASYVTTLTYGVNPDIDNQLNSSYGEIAAWQRVSAYQQWIDQSLRAHYPDAPKNSGEVKTTIVEGNSGTSLTYFMVRYLADRAKAISVISVDYATRDGTAKAGEDYLAVSGTLNIYADETYALIPVEVIGDTKAEPDETFYLDITNPVGGSFGEGVVKLTAVRTILNDDGAWG